MVEALGKRDLADRQRAVPDQRRRRSRRSSARGWRWKNIALEDLERILAHVAPGDGRASCAAALWIIGTIGSLAPFIGLFGTVVGIMKAFHEIAIEGSGGFEVVAAGISEALIATAVGLGVAIIALAFYNYLNVKIGLIGNGFARACERLVQALLYVESSTQPPRPAATHRRSAMAIHSLPSADEMTGDDIVAEINITPLTDIFLVLLIIFMVTTSVISNQGKNVDLPSSAVASQTPAGVTVTVTADDEIAVDGTVGDERRARAGARRPRSTKAQGQDRDPARRPRGACSARAVNDPRHGAGGRRHGHRARHQAPGARREK